MLYEVFLLFILLLHNLCLQYIQALHRGPSPFLV